MSAQLKLFETALPRKPYCSDQLESGLLIRSRGQAVRRRYVQHNAPNSILWLAFDVDRPTCPEEAYELGLPLPNIWIQNPENRHAHLLYSLGVPVHLNPNSSPKAQRFLASIDVAMTHKLDADAGYAGLVCKNPMHKHWNTLALNDDSYDLSYLSEFVDLSFANDLRKNLPAIGLGRNVTLFDRTREWAYKAIRSHRGDRDFNVWLDSVKSKAIAYNDFTVPLALSEITATAKSIAKYCWKVDGRAEEAFIKRQSFKGKLSGVARLSLSADKRYQAIELRNGGMTVRDIGELLGVNHTTIVRWIKSHQNEQN
jgi:hypothetical protein